MSFIHLNMERCQAWSVEYNTRAHRVLEFCGFKKGGVVRNTVYVAGKKWDSFHFDVLCEEYMNVRMDLLKKMLGEKTDIYLEKTRPIFKPLEHVQK